MRQIVDTSIVLTDAVTGAPLGHADFYIRRVPPNNEANGAVNKIDGYASFWIAEDGPGIPQAILTVWKDGYQTLVQPIAIFQGMGMIRVSLQQVQHVRPTREQVLDLRTCYCAMKDRIGRIMFTPFIGRWWLDGNMTDFNMWVEDLKAAECKHIVTAFQSGDYNYGDGTSYFIKGFDFTGREGDWQAMLAYLLDAGLIPANFLTNGDNAAELDHLEARCRATLPFADVTANCMGWEMIGEQDATISSKQFFDAMTLMRTILGSTAVIFMHVADSERITWASARGHDVNQPVDGCYWSGSSWVENDDPSHGDEVAAMRMLQIDALALQTRHGSGGPSYTLGDVNDPNTWSGHMVECADRYLPTGTFIPAVNRGAAGPDWFRQAPTRTRFWAGFETVCYEYSRDRCTEDQAKAASAVCRSIVPGEGCYRS